MRRSDTEHREWLSKHAPEIRIRLRSIESVIGSRHRERERSRLIESDALRREAQRAFRRWFRVKRSERDE